MIKKTIGACMMNVKEATAKRIEELCQKQGIAYNRLANQCGITPSTIKKVCDGLNISLKDFFDSPIFNNLDDDD